ncbi:hypothetical protein [Paraflavitalea pollutisoli]|uniref:hypothetical protein n=1 Tax=Paraflavitalea pollutisoli TaxID=3034143 RepID=UPI0023EC643C|nr:hypothetical protein [Paraflavitalea sp. H1-2-19X]
MKYLLGCLLLLAQPGWAQTSETAVGEDKISTASGNPFLFKDWMEGVVYFKSGRVVKQFKLKFDCARNRLMMQFEGNSFAAESQVKEFVIYTASKKNKDSVLFRKGYPAIDKNTEETYYHVLLNGKAELLQLHTKVLIEEKQLVNSANMSHLEDDEAFFVCLNGVMIPLPRNKEQILEKLPVQSDQLKEYVAQQTLRMDKAEDFVKIMAKYNELVP